MDIRSVSGKVSVGSAGGECCLNSKSGKISIGRVGRLAKAATISGAVELATDGTDDVEKEDDLRPRYHQRPRPQEPARQLPGRSRASSATTARREMTRNTGGIRFRLG